ncbi:hypothetical protein ABZ605_27870 [Streptomyces sp. NPDC012765]|uniref:hypothetical protein n=1 Tax=Streptomyces sp. NPDC012765 TaxID=3155249 RepID=UPI0033D75469
MPELNAVITPNSLPHPDGRVEHGYQLNVLDEDLAIVATVELAHWTGCDLREASRHLTEAGFALCSGGQDGDWRQSGMGYMARVARNAAA